MRNNDQVSSLEKKKEGLLRRLFGLKRQALKEAEEREHKAEVESLQAAIAATDDEILKARVATAKEKIAELEKEAVELQAERRQHLEKIEKIDERFFELLKLAETVIPKKRVQTASRNFVTVVRTVKMPKLTWNPFGPPTKEYEDKIEESIIPAVPKDVAYRLSEGWALKEGVKIEPEELTPENSREEPVFSLPEIFAGFETSTRPFIF